MLELFFGSSLQWLFCSMLPGNNPLFVKAIFYVVIYITCNFWREYKCSCNFQGHRRKEEMHKAHATQKVSSNIFLTFYYSHLKSKKHFDKNLLLCVHVNHFFKVLQKAVCTYIKQKFLFSPWITSWHNTAHPAGKNPMERIAVSSL